MFQSTAGPETGRIAIVYALQDLLTVFQSTAGPETGRIETIPVGIDQGDWFQSTAGPETGRIRRSQRWSSPSRVVSIHGRSGDRPHP